MFPLSWTKLAYLNWLVILIIGIRGSCFKTIQTSVFDVMRRRKTSGSREPQDLYETPRVREGDVKVHVIEVKALIWLVVGLVIGNLCAGAWMRDIQDYIRGYRWDRKDKCIIEDEKDGYGKDDCRIPVDCKICEDVTVIDEISVDDLTVEKFEKNYAYSNQPLVVRNASLKWKAMKVLDYSWIRNTYLSHESILDDEDEEEDCWFNQYKNGEFNNLKSVFRKLGTTGSLKPSKPWYVGWSVCHPYALQKLKKLFSLPAFINPESTNKERTWIFLGTPGPGAHFHMDSVDLASWTAQISGVKTWYLKPPPECWWDCHGTMETTLHPGDILVVNTNKWFHSTKVLGTDLSIGITSEFD